MKRPIFSLLSLSAVLACSIPTVGDAQVTSSLDALPAGTPAPQSSHRAVSHPQSRTHKAHIASVQVPPHETRSGNPPPVPSSPPAPIILPPPFVPIALHPPTPPEDIKAVPDAKSSTTRLPSGDLRIVFPSGDAALNPDSLTTVQNFGKTLQSHPEQRALLLAYATAPGDDLSTPRRIALARALAIRSILIHAGVATTRIYPRALGRPSSGDIAPADRVDLLVQTNPVTTPSGPSAQAPSQQGNKP